MKIYPWPFLTGDKGGDFEEYHITTKSEELTAQIKNGILWVSFTPTTNSIYINQLLENNNVRWEIEIVCNSTFFSKIFHSAYNQEIEISIPKDDLLGSISVILRVVSNKDFNYLSSEFSKEFEEVSFVMRSGDIIGEKTFHWLLDHQFSKAPGLKSIFEFRIANENDENAHSYVIEEKIIGIILPRRVFEEFHEKYTQANTSKKFLSQTVIIGPLVAILSDLSSNDPATTVERRLVYLLESKGLYQSYRKKERIQNPLKAAYELLGGDNSLIHLLVKLNLE